jgi:hypothetical protein
VLRRRPPIALLGVALGVAIGVATSFGQAHLDRPFAALVNSAAPWLVAPFLTGAACRRIWSAAPAGAGVCLLQLAAYYVTAHARGFATGEAILLFWLACGLVGGPIFGAAGFVWRHGRLWLRGLGGTAPAAAFLAEGIWVYWHTLHYGTTAALWIAIALLLNLLLARRPIEFRWLGLTLAAALVGEVVVTGVYTQSFG